MGAYGMKSRVRVFVSSILLGSCFMVLSSALYAQTSAANVSGKWQISWEARIGTERDLIQLDQENSKLTGSFQGRLGSPKVSGNVDGKNILLRLYFPGKQPYSLIFTGVIDGDKMSGKFEIPGVAAPYDFHGENVRPSNYTWQAVRIADVQQVGSNSPDKTQH
jgi:hypothetical protein